MGNSNRIGAIAELSEAEACSPRLTGQSHEPHRRLAFLGYLLLEKRQHPLKRVMRYFVVALQRHEGMRHCYAP